MTGASTLARQEIAILKRQKSPADSGPWENGFPWTRSPMRNSAMWVQLDLWEREGCRDGATGLASSEKSFSQQEGHSERDQLVCLLGGVS